MAYVITELCIGTKAASCEAICPVDCIHPAPDEQGYQDAEMLFINPSVCIDCALCVDVCPVGAIYHEHDLPDELKHFLKLNREHFEKL